MKVNVQYAQTHFSDLISAASQGEEVEIELPNQAALFLAPRPSPPKPAPLVNKNGHRILGAGRGEFRVPTDEEWDDDTIWHNPARPRSEMFGSLKGKLTLPDDWDSAETNLEIQHLFEASEIYPEAPSK